MPRANRVNPYRPQYDFNEGPTTSGALLFIGILAAVILAAIAWASFVPSPMMGSGAVNAPAAPATPSPTG